LSTWFVWNLRRAAEYEPFLDFIEVSLSKGRSAKRSGGTSDQKGNGDIDRTRNVELKEDYGAFPSEADEVANATKKEKTTP
jgi:hypothetical protein